MPDDGPFRCPLDSCSKIYDTLAGLRQHLSKSHGIKHPISQLELLSAAGYEEKEEKKEISMTINLKGLKML